jgi:hypothetical protein
MGAKIESMLIMLVIGYAVGVTFIASVTRGKSQETVVVVPEQVATRGNNIGCAFLTILGIAFLIALLTT